MILAFMGSRTWSIFNSYRGWKASERLYAGKMDMIRMRAIIIRAIAGLYLNAQSAAACVDAAESRVTASDVWHKLARTGTTLGLLMGVDVLRSQATCERQAGLLVARNQYKQSLLTLARNLGMSPNTPSGSRRAGC